MVLVYLLRLTFKEFSRKMNSPRHQLQVFPHSSLVSYLPLHTRFSWVRRVTWLPVLCRKNNTSFHGGYRVGQVARVLMFGTQRMFFPPLSLIASFPPFAHVECFTTLGTMVCFPALRICCIFSRPLHQLHVFPRKRPLCSRLHYINIFLLGRNTNNLPRPHFFFCSLGS